MKKRILKKHKNEYFKEVGKRFNALLPTMTHSKEITTTDCLFISCKITPNEYLLSNLAYIDKNYQGDDKAQKMKQFSKNFYDTIKFFKIKTNDFFK